MTNKRNAWAIAFLLLCFICGLSIIIPDTEPAPQAAGPPAGPTPLEHRGGAAEVRCERWVLKSLKSPSSAKFSDVRAYAHKGKARNHHIVKGVVDSQNSFGVILRSTFHCETHYVPERSSEWILDELIFD